MTIYNTSWLVGEASLWAVSTSEFSDELPFVSCPESPSLLLPSLNHHVCQFENSQTVFQKP